MKFLKVLRTLTGSLSCMAWGYALGSYLFRDDMKNTIGILIVAVGLMVFENFIRRIDE